MRLPRTIIAGIAVAAAAAAMATPAFAAQGPQSHARALPTHVFAPYFESFNGDNPATLSKQSGAKFLTMAFLQTAAVGSCTVEWNGDPSTPVAQSTFGAEIGQIRATGGDVIPSFGGFAADDTSTEIADSCTSVPAIAAAYENVVTTYNVTRLDLDTEDLSLTNTAGIDRRNKAIKLVEDWAAVHHRTVQFVYTLPTTPNGLAPTGLAVLQNAVANHARVDIVNIMTFDYFDGLTHEMATDTETAGAGLISQLHTLFPHRTTARLWSMVGVTEMVGIDDFGAAETFTLADATTVQDWALAHNITSLSFWAIERDNGSCPGLKGQGVCSGVDQQTWQFSHIFEPFTRNGGRG
ncbi:MAG TPA: chitinase [Pseudonocardiaceae bacterium]|jgi:chitinase|nr:chitinase [Pseudonocardiaceae bacterium]